VAVDSNTSEADRARAVEVMDVALALAGRSLLREAQSTLAGARENPTRSSDGNWPGWR
jgi:hypothetical protein